MRVSALQGTGSRGREIPPLAQVKALLSFKASWTGLAGLEQKVLPSSAALPELMAELGTKCSFQHLWTQNFCQIILPAECQHLWRVPAGKTGCLYHGQGK